MKGGVSPKTVVSELIAIASGFLDPPLDSLMLLWVVRTCSRESLVPEVEERGGCLEVTSIALDDV